jgi:hypothetical protein
VARGTLGIIELGAAPGRIESILGSASQSAKLRAAQWARAKPEYDCGIKSVAHQPITEHTRGIIRKRVVLLD